MSHPYQEPAASVSQLGFHPRPEDAGMASPRPSAQMSFQEKEQFLPYQPGSPYSAPLHDSTYPPAAHNAPYQSSYFDDEAHSGATRGAPAAFASTRSGAAAGAPKQGSIFKRKPWLIAVLALLAIAAIGGGIAAWKILSHSKMDSDKGVGNNASANEDTKPNSGTSSGDNATVTPVITPLARYDWRDPNNVAYGINLGNWLVLERWLDEDWFTGLCPDCEDEWNWSAHLGNNAVSTLQQHYSDYIQESDIDTMQSTGINMIRVTLGYWALIDTPGEPFVNAGQLDRLRMLMEWCHKRGIYITISMHGMPGSQSGDQSTGLRKDFGVEGTSWYTKANQARSDTVIQALATWITQQQNYSSVIAAVLPVNEPKQFAGNVYSDDWQTAIQNFYVRSYKTLSNIGMVMAIHPGYRNGQDPTEWGSYISSNNMDPNLVIWETHPYPGFFPANSDEDNIISTVCQLGQIHNNIQVPVFFGEWSDLSGITSPAWLKKYWNTQLAAYSSSGGSAFWTWRAKNSSNPVRALTSNQMSRYDYQFLLAQNIVTPPATGQSIKDHVSSLPNNACAGQSRRRRSAHRGERMARLDRAGGQ
ncbi:unnamed protein product [Tilletia laevis]|uniref:glucan 1,3-beta-glucosidase n=4 Tax=Tilletia TaxID=13289 RepID=A0A8X7SXG2_9BASI|nr:hypothetical protein CF336_g1503 [Tilletia laevis]KAE8248058.1 hypothetical protein A4X06_0g3990 [Tilletia controversa]KAE8263124.1 hypothetical protein A4X03_0g1914 [Tilletia caries]KAE8204007.1 hypothetical protein CF335_g2806 [Tilletia laevis]CAD6892141.1 unnamed protein product [Tilletia caries]